MTKNNDVDIRQLVNALIDSYREEEEIIKLKAENKINAKVIVDIIENLRCLIFAGYFGSKRLKSDSMEYYAGELLEYLSYNLQKQIAKALRNQKDAVEDEDETEVKNRAQGITYAFLERLPEVRRLLAADVVAAFDGDPAAYSKDEIILCYPSIFAIMVSRLAHELYLLKVPLIPRMMTEHAHSVTGIDIHPGATIGHHFFIDHGTGIVVGETTIIGNHVKVYQGVTLGALSTRGGQVLKGVKRHPTIEDHVTIYSGASIFGGGTVIGEGVVIGSNAFITKSVPGQTRVSIKNPELQYLNDQEANREEFWDFMI
ncbi:MAG: serine acetyltransferase [Syntrophomonadaceae bacterium]|nr:serine acetyltransferase [Syntrophomonadaceae bacterium]